jgi:hypothetical protein
MVTRRVLELKFKKERDLWENPEQDGFARYCKIARREKRTGKK